LLTIKADQSPKSGIATLPAPPTREQHGAIANDNTSIDENAQLSQF
jgi:hypothetical protein